MSNPIPPTNFTPLRQFRQPADELLDHRQDAFFELLDAVIQTPTARSFAELSLAPACQRQWHSLYKALAELTISRRSLNFVWLACRPIRSRTSPLT